jgi:hypothetical protein
VSGMRWIAAAWWETCDVAHPLGRSAICVWGSDHRLSGDAALVLVDQAVKTVMLEYLARRLRPCGRSSRRAQVQPVRAVDRLQPSRDLGGRPRHRAAVAECQLDRKHADAGQQPVGRLQAVDPGLGRMRIEPPWAPSITRLTSSAATAASRRSRGVRSGRSWPANRGRRPRGGRPLRRSSACRHRPLRTRRRRRPRSRRACRGRTGRRQWRCGRAGRSGRTRRRLR